jgi:hypothetical protein
MTRDRRKVWAAAPSRFRRRISSANAVEDRRVGSVLGPAMIEVAAVLLVIATSVAMLMLLSEH